MPKMSMKSQHCKYHGEATSLSMLTIFRREYYQIWCLWKKSEDNVKFTLYLALRWRQEILKSINGNKQLEIRERKHKWLNHESIYR